MLLLNLKIVFPTASCFCLDGYFGSCVVVIIVTNVAVVFIYLFIYSFIYLFIHFFCFLFFLFICLFTTFCAASTGILIFVVIVVIATVAFVVGVIVAFCACLVIVSAN